MRQCTRCHETKLDEAYTGKHSWCKVCTAEYGRLKRQNETPEQKATRKAKRNASIAKNKTRVREQERKAYQARKNKDPEKFKFQVWESHLKYDYNITVDQWYEMLAAQNNVCGICKKPQKESQRRFAVDHDHNCCTGFGSCGKCIRGLLCSYCNTKIEFAVDNIEAIKQWISK